MRYTLTIANNNEQIITEYHNAELISKDRDMARFRVNISPEWSVNPEHPDYILFSVFRDGVVNVYEYSWNSCADDIFEPGYNADKIYTCQCKKIWKK